MWLGRAPVQRGRHLDRTITVRVRMPTDTMMQLMRVQARRTAQHITAAEPKGASSEQLCT